MVPAPLRSIRRLLSVILLAAPLAVPVTADAQAAAHPPLDATQPELGEAAITGDVARPETDSPAVVAAPATPAATVAAPFAAAAVAGVHTTMVPGDALARAESVAPAALAQRANSGFQQSQVLMIVGGAAVLLGLVTDGAASDLLLIGGAAVGLYGLYRYLQ
ncbi:MAG: hypothetical protein ACYC2G_15165 [Gemmatimonadaceae bacterium]